jgi:hypothetical protein
MAGIMAGILRVTHSLCTHPQPAKNNHLNELMNFIEILHYFIIYPPYVQEGKPYRPALSNNWLTRIVKAAASGRVTA